MKSLHHQVHDIPEVHFYILSRYIEWSRLLGRSVSLVVKTLNDLKHENCSVADPDPVFKMRSDPDPV